MLGQQLGGAVEAIAQEKGLLILHRARPRPLEQHLGLRNHLRLDHDPAAAPLQLLLPAELCQIRKPQREDAYASQLLLPARELPFKEAERDTRPLKAAFACSGRVGLDPASHLFTDEAS